MKQPFDVARASEALSRPGIDPLMYTTLAIVTAVNATDQGVYCDVVTIMGLPEHAAFAPQYGGPGYGFYTPIEVDDFVLLAIPEGDWNTGARVIAAVWDRGHPPPAQVTDHPHDVALVVKPGRTVRIVASGGGNIVIEATDGTVLLGSEEATRGVARLADPIGISGTNLIALQAQLDARYAIANPASALAGTIAGVITGASEDVKST